MKAEFADQWNIVCIAVDGTEKADDIIERCIRDEATYDDGEDVLMCVQFPGRPQELYTQAAVIRSLASPLSGKEGQHNE